MDNSNITRPLKSTEIFRQWSNTDLPTKLVSATASWYSSTQVLGESVFNPTHKACLYILYHKVLVSTTSYLGAVLQVQSPLYRLESRQHLHTVRPAVQREQDSGRRAWTWTYEVPLPPHRLGGCFDVGISWAWELGWVPSRMERDTWHPVLILNEDDTFSSCIVCRDRDRLFSHGAI